MLAAGANEFVGDIVRPVVHVRGDREQQLVALERVAALYFVAGCAGGNAKEEIAQVHAPQNALRRCWSQVEAHAGPVGLPRRRR